MTINEISKQNKSIFVLSFGWFFVVMLDVLPFPIKYTSTNTLTNANSCDDYGT